MTIACVSPRWNSAEPCTRGRSPTSQLIGRMVRPSRPSMRLPVSSTIVAHDVVLALLELGLDELLRGQELLGAELRGERLDDRLLDDRVPLVALLLLLDDAGRAEIGVDELGDALGDALVELRRDELALRLADRGAHLLDELEDRLRWLVREHQRVDEVFLAALGGAAFDHHDRVFADGDDDVEVGSGCCSNVG